MGFDRPSRPWALALLLGVVPAPPQDDLPTGMVTGLRARHEAGQTILTWREVDPPVTAESIPVAELRRIRSALDRGRKVRYRIYRSGQPIDQESIKGLQPIAEVPPLTCWNADYTGIDCKPEHQAMRYVVEEGKGPVPPGFLHRRPHAPAAPEAQAPGGGGLPMDPRLPEGRPGGPVRDGRGGRPRAPDPSGGPDLQGEGAGADRPAVTTKPAGSP